MKKLFLLTALALSSNVFATAIPGDSTGLPLSFVNQATQRTASSGAVNAQSRAIVVQQPQPIVNNYYVSNVPGPQGPQGPQGPAGPSGSGVQFAYQDFGGCGGILYGPVGATVNLQFTDASGCNANGGCNVWKTIGSNGYITTLSSNAGSGGYGYAFYNGKQVANWVTWTNCGGY